MSDQPSDQMVVGRVLAGDVESFGILVNRYRDKYFGIACRILGNREDAEDALQETFIRSYRSLGSCTDPARFGSWLYSILINQCRTSGTRRGMREKRNAGDMMLDSLPDEAATIQTGDLQQEVEFALARLTQDQREAFLLKHVEDLSYEEMSEITGDSISALKMRVKRAVEGLRIQLEKVQP